MGLLNYTTEIAVARTIAEIQQMLTAARATAILQELDGAGNTTALSFKIDTEMGLMAFRLPCEPVAVSQILNNQVRDRKIPRRFMNDMDQARRVGWRIIRQWLEAQLAIVETKMVRIEQVFLPYAQNAEGKTLYESLREHRFSGLLLEAPR